ARTRAFTRESQLGTSTELRPARITSATGTLVPPVVPPASRKEPCDVTNRHQETDTIATHILSNPDDLARSLTSDFPNLYLCVLGTVRHTAVRRILDPEYSAIRDRESSPFSQPTAVSKRLTSCGERPWLIAIASADCCLTGRSRATTCRPTR